MQIFEPFAATSHSRSDWPQFLISLVALGCAAAPASATIILQDNFALGSRPNASGATVPVNIGTSLAGKQAQVPGTPSETWITSNSPSWAFSSSSADPFEAPGTPAGSVTYNIGDENPARPSSALALLAFSAPAQVFEETLDVISFVRTNVTIGFTSSTSTALDNFNTFGQFTLNLSAPFGIGGEGLWTLRTLGANGQTIAGTTQLQGFNRLLLRYNPAAQAVEGFVNGVSTGILSYSGSTISAVGFSGNGTVDNFAVEGFDVPSTVPEPASWAFLIVGFAGIGLTLRRRKVAPSVGVA